MGDDLVEIEKWAAAFKQPALLVETASKLYLLHRKPITHDVSTIKADRAASEYFLSGRSVADLVTTLVPME